MQSEIYYQNIISQLLNRVKTEHTPDRVSALIIINGAKIYGLHMFAIQTYLKVRREWLNWHCQNQRHWQQKVSRRMQRCKTLYSVPNRSHCESRVDPGKWLTRERYMRCNQQFSIPIKPIHAS